jgi:putative oxidoreductase
MNSLQRYVLSLSRVLMSIVFLLNGLGIINQAVAAKELIEHGAPASVVPFLMLISRTIEIFAGFSLASGIYPRLAAVAILAVLFRATLTAHAFWQVAGTDAFTPQLLNFFKNIAMMGSLLFIAATQSQPSCFRALRGQTFGNGLETRVVLAVPYVRLDIGRVSSGLKEVSRDRSLGGSSNVTRVGSTTFAIPANDRWWKGRRP